MSLSAFIQEPSVTGIMDFRDPMLQGVIDIATYVGTPVVNIDVCEKSDHYCVCVDLPGFEKENINVNIDNHVLTIRAFKDNHYSDSVLFYRRERGWGNVVRTLRLPSNANSDASSCDFIDGVLIMNFPKLASAVGHKKLAIA